MKLFKVLLSAILCMVIAFSVTGCKGRDKRVLDAIEVLKEAWSERYNQSEIEDKHFEIVNTRIINIKEDIDDEKAAEMFGDVDYMVEFELLTNRLGTSPYYEKAGGADCVVVYKDGSKKVNVSLLTLYRAATFKSDYSGIIESIENFKGEYDCILKLN